MRWVIVAFLASSGCLTRRNPEYCDEANDLRCESGLVCVDHRCVEPADAAPIDGPAPDGPRAVVATYQPADLVLGQANLDEGVDVGCVRTSAAARDVAVSNGVVYVRESASRALAWSPLPTGNNVAASYVIGKTTFTDCTEPSTLDARYFGGTGSIAAASGKLLVSDGSYNRVLWWSPAPATDGEYANGILGQTTYSSTGAGDGAGQLSDPAGIWTDGNRVILADRGNHRVLIWNSFPSSNAEAADIVLGQDNFGASTPPSSPTNSNLFGPSGVWCDGTRLFVSDTGHNRVLIWNSIPTVNGDDADLVIGHATFTESASGLSATALYLPRGLAGNADALFVADSLNDRVTVYAPIPTTSGVAATYVLGQPSLDVGGNQPPPNERSLSLPLGLAVAGDHLWVADFGHRRTVRFSLYPP